MNNLSPSNYAVLKTLGGWSTEDIYGRGLQRFFSHKSGRVNVLVTGSRHGYARKEYYYYRWLPVEGEPNQFYPTHILNDEHQNSLAVCLRAVKAWQKAAL